MLMNIPLLLLKESVLKERLSPIIFVLFNFRILNEPNPPSTASPSRSVGQRRPLEMNYESTTLSHEDIDSLETILREANWTETTGAVVGVAPCSWGGWWQLPDKHPDRINIFGNRNVVCSLLRGFASLRFSRHHLFLFDWQVHVFNTSRTFCQVLFCLELAAVESIESNPRWPGFEPMTAVAVTLQKPPNLSLYAGIVLPMKCLLKNRKKQ